MRAKPQIKQGVEADMKKGEFTIERSGETPDGQQVVVATVDQHVALIVDKEIKDMWDITKRDAALAVFDRMIKVGAEKVRPYSVDAKPVDEALLRKDDLELLKHLWTTAKESNNEYEKHPDIEHADKVIVNLKSLVAACQSYGSSEWLNAAQTILGRLDRQTMMAVDNPRSMGMKNGGLPSTYEFDHVQNLLHTTIKLAWDQTAPGGESPRMWEGWNRDRSGKLTHSSGAVIRQSANPEETGKWLVYLPGKAMKPKAFDTVSDAKAYARKNLKEWVLGEASSIYESPTGECYRDAYQYVKAHPNAMLVQGATHPIDGAKPAYNHAWAEDGGTVIEPWWGQTPKDKWYAHFRPTDVHKYNSHEAKVKVLSHKNYGPWDAAVVADDPENVRRAMVGEAKPPRRGQGGSADSQAVKDFIRNRGRMGSGPPPPADGVWELEKLKKCDCGEVYLKADATTVCPKCGK